MVSRMLNNHHNENITSHLSDESAALDRICTDYKKKIY